MGRGVRGIRGLGVAGLVLGGMLLALLAASLGASEPARAQSVSQIVVEGNRRVEAQPTRPYFRAARGHPPYAARIATAPKAMIRTGLFHDLPLHQAPAPHLG